MRCFLESPVGSRPSGDVSQWPVRASAVLVRDEELNGELVLEREIAFTQVAGAGQDHPNLVAHPCLGHVLRGLLNHRLQLRVVVPVGGDPAGDGDLVLRRHRLGAEPLEEATAADDISLLSGSVMVTSFERLRS